ncbi:beta strand repeat-containing protein [Aquabacterium sp. OR-4]|uniref:beta strand repeat-containing protein n=1 Tax=Aquabacterium sp. OR-4 TaxID=2978127 RepID=UPI0021B16589|nr:PEP-CTERM sorting domain-containing protein [Aquabacterium sp. OR-4]MDT7835415.1 PEP-CTERM sorting domain-containing protein [Aquabacterium sp. OR-4]
MALASLGLVAALPAQAQFSSSGAVQVYPALAAVPSGPGNADLGNVGLQVGHSAPGSFNALGGSQLRVGTLAIGPSGNGSGHGTVLIDGSGTVVRLVGDGFSDGVINRLGVGEWGHGALTVSGGAVLDGRAEAASCLGQFHYCNNFIGNAAGSTGVFTVSGAGSQASFLRFFGVGGLAVFHPPVDSFTFGTPGGSTRGTVNVLAGGTLITDNAHLGLAPGGSSPTGSERSFAEASIQGAGSLWRVTGGTLEPGQYARFLTAQHTNASVSVTVAAGGEIRIEGDGNAFTAMNLSSGGGRTDMLVTGAGSRVHFQGMSGVLNVTTSTGTAFVDIRDGGVIDGMFYAAVGRSGGVASLTIDGHGSLMRVDGTATAAANGSSNVAAMDIGRNGGRGSVTVGNGGRLELLASTSTTGGLGFSLGRDANSSGSLNIGAGGVVLLRSESSAPDSAAETWNPFMRVGRDGNGTLAITDGGQLLLQGGAVSTPANRRSTSLYIGGSGEFTVGGKGVATVSGSGSEIRLTGTDAFIGVGVGPQSTGQLAVRQGGAVHGLGIVVGRGAGVGLLTADNGTLSMSGQQSAGSQSGAFLVVADGGGVGVATLANASVMTLANAGTDGAGFTIGGSSYSAGGDGSLTLSGGSRLTVTAGAGLAGGTVGRDGSGLLRLRGASQLDLGDGNLYVGRLAGGDGTVIASEGSTLTAGWVGVGARKTDTGHEDGGTGTVVLINSRLHAQQVVIGTHGFLGGTGTISGGVTHRGTLAPGNSPGTLVIQGGFTAEAGSRMVLEIEGDATQGFRTDTVVFGAGQPLDLDGLAIEFHFLGSTDPNAFAASGGFEVESFLRQQDGQGGSAEIAAAALAGASFSAQSSTYDIRNFSFDAVQGAVFTANPVPEPGSWALLAGGLLGLALRLRRRLR